MPAPRATLTERISAVHAEIESFIDAKVAELKKECPGIPDESLRRDLTRGDHCLCRAYAAVMKD
jgi:hypothetical protein